MIWIRIELKAGKPRVQLMGGEDWKPPRVVQTIEGRSEDVLCRYLAEVAAVRKRNPDMTGGQAHDWVMEEWYDQIMRNGRMPAEKEKGSS